MDPLANLKRKHDYVLPTHPKASGHVTMYLKGYPTEDDEPMSATEFHGRQISNLSSMLISFFGYEQSVYVGTDSFIYYQAGNPSKCVAPDVYVVFGVDAIPARSSFYTWAEGAVPAVAFEFLSESTKRKDREDKPKLYLQEIGMQEYFIHQPSPDYPFEFRGWRRTEAGEIVEIVPDERGGIFSEALGLWFLVDDGPDKVRLMRPYLPDGTLMQTHKEAVDRSKVESKARQDAEAKVQVLEAELETLRQLLAQRSES